jgi:hypothetical protein
MLSNLTNRIITIVVILALAVWLDLSPQIQIPNPVEEGASLFVRDVSTRLPAASWKTVPMLWA